MSFTEGSHVGPYEVLSLLGTGGMGEVYRARDARLNRDVALKRLPGAFATDPDRVGRFRREAQVLGTLNHPNIAQIYGFEDSGGTPVLVLELVEGPTLADRLAQGPLDLDDALGIARHIALALEAAHHQSIIHRDLKPANVKVRDDGTVKVLDFGLAKAFEPASDATDAANSPTLTNRATALGMILGTAAYMAPEQARGKPVDKRADIWSFGVVLFEMLSGKQTFSGESVSETLAEVLKADPEWTALPAATPDAIRRLLRRCLQRDPSRRLHDIADARLEIEDALVSPAESVSEASPHPGWRERLLWVAALAGTAAVAAALTLQWRPAPIDPPETRLQIIVPSSGTSSLSHAIAMSPDGRAVAYWAPLGGTSQLWLRPLAEENAKPLRGADGPATNLAWSPDGRSILFGAPTLKEVSVDGGSAYAVPAPSGGFGLTRNADGIALFAPANAAPIARVALSGGMPEPATRVTPPQVGHRYPYFLPDGRHFLFLVSGPPGVQGIFLGELDSLEARRLVEADTAAVFAPPNFVVFGRQDSLFAQRLNLRTYATEGEPLRLAERILQNRGIFGSIALAASSTGAVAYRQAAFPEHQLTWLDRAGKVVSVVGGIDAAETDASLRLSPDGRTVIFGRRENGNSDLWTIANAPYGALQRFTSHPALDANPVWSPDGQQIAFQSSRKGGGFYDLYRRSIAGGSDETVLLESADNKTMNDWSLDNGYLLFVLQGREQVPRDLWAIPVGGDGKAFPVATTPYDETNGRFSPDSRWVAYQSNAAGSIDVYVRPFPGPGREWRISVGGGSQPKWRGDGRELYYIGPGGQLMAAPIRLPAAGDALEHDTPVLLFNLRGSSAFLPDREGQRFLVRQILHEVPTPPITVLQNWQRK
jgi:serine/threonine protein kinase/Tol biopolymer transport system component